MNSLYLAIAAVFPLAFMMFVGYVLTLKKVWEEPFTRQLNSICFKVYFPFLIFYNIYQSDFYSLFSLKLILFAVGSIITSFLLLVIIIPLIAKDNRDRGAIIQGMFRSNFILFGIPIVHSLYGGENIGVVSILIAFVVPMFNFLAIISLSIFSDKKQPIFEIIKKICKNPLIIGSVLGLIAVLLRVKFPVMLEDAIADIAHVTTPASLMVLGGSFKFNNLHKFKGFLTIAVVGKLVVIPGIFLSLAILLGFRGVELASLMAMLASPTAVSSFTMAQSMGANDELAGQIVVMDSIFSVVTIFGWITLFSFQGLL
ncbi:hypothetical protein AN639_10180 [Candidatus Epulonipiscium fishelsonii]|uniref:Uncharacterized protein n=1 Tax=Candidatus Epulonipiscium fishelsonii TaxID=77094 RepID=A0ACC8XE69_9FIRM|nr:hypothetical protein AN396_03715 [Epulopiscium sp. SCG-B11WGA-EpuloA1]ONI43688.1 hypothetical protein AN639_10180 [Epulopiscium sp. SCG-B05WGA-EpuloA1]